MRRRVFYRKASGCKRLARCEYNGHRTLGIVNRRRNQPAAGFRIPCHALSVGDCHAVKRAAVSIIFQVEHRELEADQLCNTLECQIAMNTTYYKSTYGFTKLAITKTSNVIIIIITIPRTHHMKNNHGRQLEKSVHDRHRLN